MSRVKTGVCVRIACPTTTRMFITTLLFSSRARSRKSGIFTTIGGAENSTGNHRQREADVSWSWSTRRTVAHSVV